MPVIRAGRCLAPPWCELEYFEVVRLSAGEGHCLHRPAPREKLIVAEGSCALAAPVARHVYGPEDVLVLSRAP